VVVTNAMRVDAIIGDYYEIRKGPILEQTVFL